MGSFDKQLLDYVETTYVRDKYVLSETITQTTVPPDSQLTLMLLRYQTQFGCDNVDIKNTTELYARFTITTVCNSIVQNSIYSCELSEEDSEPICADTCVSCSLVYCATLALSLVGQPLAH